MSLPPVKTPSTPPPKVETVIPRIASSLVVLPPVPETDCVRFTQSPSTTALIPVDEVVFTLVIATPIWAATAASSARSLIPISSVSPAFGRTSVRKLYVALTPVAPRKTKSKPLTICVLSYTSKIEVAATPETEKVIPPTESPVPAGAEPDAPPFTIRVLPAMPLTD